MKSGLHRVCLLAMLLIGSADARAEFGGIGRAPTASELQAWDIDVRPDFIGLPAGKGSVAEGETIWAQQCASCHGDFGDANHVFTPLIGNTTADDIRTGRVASLKAGGSYRTTFTKVSSISTLWDYIRRAMPWDRPRSLSVDQVYAVLAYLLNLADVVPADFVLTEQSIVQVQSRMPNRDGMTRDHGLWDVKGRPDTRNTACMRNCLPGDPQVSSALPAHASGSHGDLASQNRPFGAVRGTQVGAAATPASADASATSALPSALNANGCMACHAVDSKLVGPAFAEIAKKYSGRADAESYLASRIRDGGSGVWGSVPMPPFPQLSADSVKSITKWIAQGAPR
ncbi:MAG: c-type cytochrome [Panacagrimonas sp.]|jgi:cytochrome c|nr:c-type cytochrome [Panacagrimonas sp.]MCC2658678.1 c-type cytochrome [Panacagrimonas sp.]